jgi:phosphoadenosine phosphosulfate reductase
MLIEEKTNIAIDRIRFSYNLALNRGKKQLYVAFSGGKDSQVIAELCRLAGIKYTLNYNMTGIDHPELIYFMRENYPELIWNPYKKSMWQLIVKKGFPPTRLVRYCCEFLKERGGDGEFCVTGVRWAESNNRKKNRKPFENNAKSRKNSILFNDNEQNRRDFERCIPKSKIVINPIIDWTHQDVWNFIIQQNLPYCKLYDEGYKRLGCIGCPMAGAKQMQKEFNRQPKIKELYIRAFDKMLKEHNYKKQPTWQTGQEVFDWWIGKKGVEA